MTDTDVTTGFVDDPWLHPPVMPAFSAPTSEVRAAAALLIESYRGEYDGPFAGAGAVRAATSAAGEHTSWCVRMRDWEAAVLYAEVHEVLTLIGFRADAVRRRVLATHTAAAWSERLAVEAARAERA